MYISISRTDVLQLRTCTYQVVQLAYSPCSTHIPGFSAAAAINVTGFEYLSFIYFLFLDQFETDLLIASGYHHS